MTIAEARDKCKSLLTPVPRDMLIIATLILASSASFGLGYVAGLDAGQGSAVLLESPASTATSTLGQVVAAKNGTKYYPLGCTAADRIAQANKVWFISAVAAQEAGYSPSANCKGL